MSDTAERVAIVCGGRDYSDRRKVYGVLDDAHAEKPFDHIAVGGAPGADQLAQDWAAYRGVHCVVYRADWDLHGRAAGPIRNKEMLDKEKPDVVIALPGGRGTANMIRLAKAAGVEVVLP